MVTDEAQTGRNHCTDKDSLIWVCPPDSKASGKNDSTVQQIWFTSMKKQRQAAGGCMKLVNRCGDGRDQRANKILIDQKHILLFRWLSLLLEYTESDTKKKMENILYGVRVIN